MAAEMSRGTLRTSLGGASCGSGWIAAGRNLVSVALLLGLAPPLAAAAAGAADAPTPRTPYVVYAARDPLTKLLKVELGIEYPLNFRYVPDSTTEYAWLVECARINSARDRYRNFSQALRDVEREIEALQVPPEIERDEMDPFERAETWAGARAHELLNKPRQFEMSSRVTVAVSLYDFPRKFEVVGETQAQLDQLLVEIGKKKADQASQAEALFNYCGGCPGNVSLNLSSAFYPKFDALKSDVAFRAAYAAALDAFADEIRANPVLTDEQKTGKLREKLKEKAVLDRLSQ
jgi:hypothetical protein